MIRKAVNYQHIWSFYVSDYFEIKFYYRDNSGKNTFIDHYMVQANGEYVKIYLYLLRCMNGPQLSSSCLSISLQIRLTVQKKIFCVH